ncbi:MAG TPA: helix-turn-helix domain-containing protein [Pirellulales bacterium]|nr:helix-turn-helix domain-containing protein [Pirellulales bacterium]
MAVMARNKTIRRTFLLDKTKRRSERFAGLHPEIVSSVEGLRNSLARATKDSLWISYEKRLTEGLLQRLSWPSRPLGAGVFIHALDPQTLPALAACFHRFAFAADGGFLPPEELAEALQAENRADLFIGGGADRASKTLTLWRGNLQSLTVPFSAFERSGDGLVPDFGKCSVTDYGQTIRLGDYEAAAEAILYEFDPEYRRRISKLRRQTERSLGASLRRLRKQRRLRREDFGPEVAAKTIARIEQGKVQRLRKKTLGAIASRLGIAPEELAEF